MLSALLLLSLSLLLYYSLNNPQLSRLLVTFIPLLCASCPMFLLKGRAQVWIPALVEASPALRTMSGLWSVCSRRNVPVCSLVFLAAGKYHCLCIPSSLPKSCSPVSSSTQDYWCQTLLLIPFFIFPPDSFSSL